MPKGRMKLPNDLSGLLMGGIRPCKTPVQNDERTWCGDGIAYVYVAEGKGNFFEIISCAIPCAKFLILHDIKL